MSGARRLVAAFTLGLVAGAALMVPIAGRRVEQMRVRVFQTETQMKHYEEQIARLEEEQKKKRWALVVGDTRVLVDHEDSHLVLAVERLAGQEMRSLIGKPVADLDPHFVLHRLHGRLVQVEGRTYLLQVQHVLLGSRATVWITPRELPTAPDT